MLRTVGAKPGSRFARTAKPWVVVGATLLACWLLLIAVGVEYFVLVHLFYLPVVLAAFWLGWPATFGVAVAAGLLAGPLLPQEVTPDTHTRWSWLFRLLFLVGFGGVLGVLVHELRALQRRHAADLYASVTRLYARTLQAFAQALEMKDEETGEHCGRVARNAVTLGRRLGLSPSRLDALYWAGYLHDVGKLATPSHVLSKPGKLTPEEFALVQRHTQLGSDLLRGVSPAFQEIAEGVKHHHERWDGEGYPEGLAGAEIPSFGRILAVVDVFEALTSHRPYRDALSGPEAAAIVRSGVGLHFDPEAAEAFLRAIAEDEVHVEARHGRRAQGKPPDAFDPEMLHDIRR